MKFLRELFQSNLAPGRLPVDRETYEKTGSRDAFERVYFARRKALSAAALLYLAGGGEEYLFAACEEIDAILSEPTWVHPAHGEEIDLFSAETGFLLAEISTLLPLGETRKNRVMGSIFRNITSPFCARTFGWEEGRGNWLAVCMGNVAGALFYADRAAFSAQRARLERGLLRYLESFPADGWCAEGIEYWNFGFGAFVRAAELCFPELLDRPAAAKIAQYPQHCFLKGNVTASFSDCPIAGKADRGLVNFLSKRYGLPLLTAEETYIRAENCAWMPLSRALRDGFSVASTREKHSGVFCGGTVAVAHGAAYSFAVKAGNNGEEHNHNDVGAFLVSAEGGQIVADLGQPMYDRNYFSAKRYENLAASSLGHSVPIVNGKGQCAGREYGGTLSENGRRVEFARAYHNCKRMVREFTLGAREVRVSDEFSADDAIVERFVLLAPLGERAVIRSEEGLAPHVTKASYFAHDGKATPVFLVDFAVPAGRTSAAFCIFIK